MAAPSIKEVGHHFRFTKPYRFHIHGKNLKGVTSATLADMNGTVTWTPNPVTTFTHDHDGSLRFESTPTFTGLLDGEGDGSLTITLFNDVNESNAMDVLSFYAADDAVRPSMRTVQINFYT